MTDDLSILGIDAEMLAVMQQERTGKAPWIHNMRDDRQMIVAKGELVRRLPNRNYKLRDIKVGEKRIINYGRRPVAKVQNSVTVCVSYTQKKYGMKFRQNRIRRGIKITRIA